MRDPDSDPPTVLCVDDFDDARTSLQLLLEADGCRTLGAATGAEALRLVAQQPDLVVLDVVLPDMDGREVCRRMKADPATALIPVLLLSGRAVSAADRVGGLDGGADAYLTKPADPDVLVAQVRALLRLGRAEAAVRLRDRAIRAVPHGILIADPARPDIPVVYASPGFERLTGYAAAEAAGRAWGFLFGPDSDPGAAAGLGRAAADGREHAAELVLYRKDRSPFWAALSVSPVRDPAGRLTHVVALLADVTARRRLEDQVRQAQKMEAVGRLAGGVAHDFNNLLTVINGFSELALAQLPADDPVRTLVAEVKGAGDRAALLTQQLLAFSRQQVVAPRVLDPNEVARQAEPLLRRLIGEDVRVAVALDPAARPVRADPGQLGQVLLNLAVNARDAMPRGGRLTIETRNVDLGEEYARTHAGVRPGRYVLLAVSDTGTGMTPEVRAKIFEPFFTTKGVGKGTGLGLATVFGIVQQTGGHIDVYTEVGRGTTFKVYLPAADADPSPAEATDPLSQAPGGRETILLVEDEGAVRAFTGTVLRLQGYAVLEAGDGNEATRVAAGHAGSLDLLVTDVVMPGAGGREVAERLAAARPGLRVLYLSGYTDDAVVRHGVLEAQTAFLQKPFTAAALARKVREVLDAAGPSADSPLPGP